MQNREAGLLEIFERIKAVKDELGLVAFKRTPTAPVEEDKLPCVFMSSSVDSITKRSGRNNTGYPASRVLEVVLEIIVKDDTDLSVLYNDIRKAVFTQRGSDPVVYDPVLADNVFINENRTEGPAGYGLPNVVGIRLVLDLVYTDNGFY